MPGVDGYEATRRIRNGACGQAKRSIFVARVAHALAKEREHCRQVGMDAFLAKPMRIHDIQHLVATCRQQAVLRREAGSGPACGSGDHIGGQLRLVKVALMADAVAMTLNPIRWKLHWQILLSAGLGHGCCRMGPAAQQRWAGHAVETGCQRIGKKLFMNALKMVIVPLVVSSIIAGVMRLGAEQGVGRMGAKTLLYYTLSGATAVLVGGMLAVNLLGPGRIDAAATTAMLGQRRRHGHRAGPDGQGRGQERQRHRRHPVADVPGQYRRGGDQQWKPAGDHHLLPALWAVHRQARTCDARCTIEFLGQLAASNAQTHRVHHPPAPIGVFGLVTPVIHRHGQRTVRRHPDVLPHRAAGTGPAHLRHPRPRAEIPR